MQSAFPIVVFGAVALSVVVSIAFLFSKGSLYDHIGRGGFSQEGEGEAGAFGAHDDWASASASASRAERELEIRQMLQARSERLAARGEQPLDVDAEVAKLLDPEPHPSDQAGLVEEVRQLVIARNERRLRRGLEPLEIDDEVARTLAELGA